ncbi:rod shape-determining protein MreC [Paenibacillus alginolyticus]|uniref:Cell shape-determining protein MreC n=1 Tax=Paenibacillus alginolyticus TaxID=59839 RepID=A0ABT4GDK8_9BACL|nr:MULTISPECIES: rod shape-determining protein MreC [Paenibacillus]MCY9663766.1 rod shape-determining protein MreC [Paenibacillus alginolyticus]MCY9694277.1 rod shape-determining protein MreC [Paenibacillus alginolyticus]MEC0142827.1 rod shape-determining protein MreC [Paenibacillus alginolyticus]
MFKFMGNKRLIFLMFGLVCFFILMGLTLGNRAPMTWPEKFVKDSVSWTQGLFYKPAAQVAGFFEDIRQLRVIYEENKTLKLTLTQYARDTQRLNELESQNKRLMEALGFTERQRQANVYTYRIAEVVTIDPDPYNSTVTINLGDKDGIKENMAVMTVDGLVGRVSKVFGFHSNVQLLTETNDTDNNSKAIAVTVKGNENQPFGMIESYDAKTGELVMNKVEHADDMKIGDTIITSGMGQVFPKGIEVGTISSIGPGEFGITYKVMVKPKASFNRIREVFVVEVPEVK